MVRLLVADLGWLRAVADDHLTDLAVAIKDEQQRRALDRGDLAAVVEQGFADGFSGAKALAPYLIGDLLVCPGVKLDRGMSHECSFCTVEGVWVWEHADVASDHMRHVPQGRNAMMRTITVIPAWEGMAVDQVESKASRGVHEMRKASSFTVTGGQLIKTALRARKVESHSGR